MKSCLVMIGAAVALFPLAAAAETPEEIGLQIAVEADARDTGYGDSEVTMEMVLRNRHGEESVRTFRTKSLEVEGDGDKGLSIFDEPRDVKGTALLTFTHKTESDDQ